jgi:hypothetical protein
MTYELTSIDACVWYRTVTEVENYWVTFGEWDRGYKWACTGYLRDDGSKALFDLTVQGIAQTYAGRISGLGAPFDLQDSSHIESPNGGNMGRFITKLWLMRTMQTFNRVFYRYVQDSGVHLWYLNGGFDTTATYVRVREAVAAFDQVYRGIVADLQQLFEQEVGYAAFMLEQQRLMRSGPPRQG